ncbi:sensor histidine kinase [Microbacterium rhizophilus]|uniref:sensor histidine kinase n=1 Tax=Microbacterium rhizophilus TaxID=3138934 RepID=UPI0031E5EF7C
MGAQESRSSALLARFGGVAAVAVLVGAAAMVAAALAADRPALTWELVQNVSLTLALAAVAGGLAHAPAAAPVATVLLAAATGGAASVLANGLGDLALGAGWAAAVPLHLASGALWPIHILPLITFLPAAFPAGPPRGRGWRIVEAATIIAMIALGVAEITAERIAASDPAMPNPLASPAVSEAAAVVGIAIAVPAVIASAAVLVARCVRGGAPLRRQVGVLAAVLVSGLAFNAAHGAVPEPVFQLGMTIWPLALIAAIAVAVVRHGLYDVRVVVNRLAVYSLLTIVLGALFAIAYLAGSSLLAALPAPAQPWAAAVTGALAVAAFAEPVRRGLQRRLERAIVGSRGSPLDAIVRLRESTDHGDEPAVGRAILMTFIDAVRATSGSLHLHRDGRLVEVAAAGTPTEPVIVLPLEHRGERLGEVRLAGRSPGERYTRGDEVLLAHLAEHSAVVIFGVRRDAELTAARQAAIRGAAEVRARIGRDLHDGFAPLLAGAGLTAEALRRSLPAGTPEAESAARLAERLRLAASDARRFAHDMQRSPVAEAGLVGATAEHVDALNAAGGPRISLQAACDRPLPPEVEQAAHLVVLEALANVIRHAEATRVLVSLVRDADDLVVEVADDGRGMPSPYVSGMGLTSMRRRVEELDGAFAIDSADRGGTTVRARIRATP